MSVLQTFSIALATWHSLDWTRLWYVIVKKSYLYPTLKTMIVLIHLFLQNLFFFQMQAYYSMFEQLMAENLPKIYSHFLKSHLTPDLYLLDWIYTVYAKAMPLDVACRVWDVFLRDGEEFLFRTALGKKVLFLIYVYV